MKIYTKTGDKGETSLFGGVRVSKAHAQVDAYGSVDELNSWIGLLVSEITLPEKKEFLQKIQSDLLTIGGSLAGWKTELALLVTRVTEMEVEIDAMEAELPKLVNFILPGGTKGAATAHVVRSTTRKVERKVVELFSDQSSAVSFQQKEEDQQIILQYFNRLSDFFFVLGRFINMRAGVEDIPWIGIERKKS